MKRLLWVGEATYLNTGYAEYGRELLTRLHKTGKYEIAELAAYGSHRDSRAANIPWNFYGNLPEPGEEKFYSENGVDQFGKFKFNQVCAQFKPTHVATVTDPWMNSFVEYSPLRQFYSRLFLLPVDSIPQQPEWVSSAVEANAFLTYTQWGGQEVDKQSGGKAKWFGAAPGGVDFDTFSPIEDKVGLRNFYHIEPDANIVGFVGRNQARKLIPDLMESFQKYLTLVSPEVAAKSFLYLHTSWPDLGWDIPTLINDYGLASKVLMTYRCTSCHAVYPSHFQDTRSVCRHCGRQTLEFPNSDNGISRAELAQIYNLFDVFVQTSSAEGIGLCQLEAAACGVPIMSVNYSAMAEVVRKLLGTPIPVKGYTREAVSQLKRAVFDIDALAVLLKDHFKLSPKMRCQHGNTTRDLAMKCFDWQLSVDVWMRAMDETEPSLSWDTPYRRHNPRKQIPNELKNTEFIHWALTQVAGRPELNRSSFALKLLTDLNRGTTTTDERSGNIFAEESLLGSRTRVVPFSRKDVVRQLLTLAEEREACEQLRMSK